MKRTYAAGSILIAAAILLLAAFHNGYPLVTADAATYLDSGFALETPFDRPITYGLFIRLLSLNGFSLWPVIGAQAIMTAGLLYAVLRLMMPGARARIGLLIMAAILAVATPLSWIVSALMPDIFTPIALLSLLLIVIANMPKARRAALYFLYFASICMHLSHVMLFAVLVIILFLLRKWIAGVQWRAYFGIPKMGLLLFLSVAAIAIMGSALAKSRHVFFMGAMVERGVTQAYLDEYCPTIPYKLCAYKDALPDRGYAFVWDSDGALQHTGGWEGSRNEYNDIIYATLTKPKYIWLQIRSSIFATYVQLRLSKIGDGNIAFGTQTSLYKYVAKDVPREAHAFSGSLQNTGDLLPVPMWQAVMKVAVKMSILLLLLLALPRVRRHTTLRSIVCIVVAGVVINAWDCATFANAIDRLGARMIWLVPFTVMMMMAHAFLPKAMRQENSQPAVRT